MELSIKKKAKRYDEIIKRAKGEYAKFEGMKQGDVLEDIFPELKESEDELTWLTKYIEEEAYSLSMDIRDNEDRIKLKKLQKSLAWLEKQGDNPIKWNKNTEENKPQVNHSVLMKTTHGITEGEWKGEYWYQYRWSGTVRDTDVLSWMELSDLEKQDGHGHTKLPEENDIDEEYKIGKWFTGLIPCWINAPSTLQPEHSYHGKNVIAIHLKGGGYRCCCIDDKKPIVFNVAKNTPFEEGWHNRESSAWSEEDESWFKEIELMCLNFSNDTDYRDEFFTWLKSLKNKVQPQPKHEWSEEDEKTLNEIFSVAARASLRKSTLFGKSYDYIKWQNWLKSLKQRIGG